MDIKDYIRVVRSRWRLIVLLTLLGVAGASAFSLLTTPTYQSDAKLFVRAANADGSVGTAYTGSLFTQQRVKSYKEFVTSPTVTREVASRLGIPRLTASTVSRSLSADANLDTVNLNLHGQDHDPAVAQKMTQATAEVFREFIGKLEAPGNSISPVAIDIVLPAGSAHQVAPRTKLNLALGLLIGLAIGIGLAVLRDLLDTRVKSPADLDERFSIPTLSVVAFHATAKEHPLILKDEPSSSRAEAFRRLRTNLQFVDVDRHPSSIVISSAVEGEGKTTTSCNLAIALASAGVPVVLVDGDLRRPSVAKYLGIEQAVGLTNVLIGQVALQDALQEWGTSGILKVLPSGTLPPNPSELLGSRLMEEVLRELESEALVIIDAPPLLPVTDAAVLGATASGALLVCRLGRTRREQVAIALDALKGVGAHVYGAVLNMAPTKGPEAYSYGYGYYGTYATDEIPDIVPTPQRGAAALSVLPGVPTGSPAPPAVANARHAQVGTGAENTAAPTVEREELRPLVGEAPVPLTHQEEERTPDPAITPTADSQSLSFWSDQATRAE